MTNAIAVFVNDAIKHLQSQSYADSGRGQSFSRWFRSMENAVEILREAKSRVKQTKTPIEKCQRLLWPSSTCDCTRANPQGTGCVGCGY